ncbi:MAG TPA: CCA tRNA nucleotidyltransferase [Gemmatimonadales bacterium]|nr:CCA tRNA nucleotidyltransferase [Gemmatimonadales bacterium]
MAARAFPNRLDLGDEALAIARTLHDAGFEVWCVGGAVRDALLGAAPSGTAARAERIDAEHAGAGAAEVDFTTSATPEEVQALFRRTVPVGLKHGTIGVLDRQRVLHEVTTFRRDVETDGRHAVVAYGVSLEEDLARRDFTINAIAYHPLRHEWRDPFGGAADLAAGVIRAVGRPAERFREDYLRILRALRFAARFEFRIEPATWDAARAAAPGLERLSAERVRDEWFKGLRTARSVARLVQLWLESGAAQRWLPELAYARPPGGDYASTEVDREPRDPVLLTAFLCDDPAAVLERLRASRAEIARAEAIARGPAEPGGGAEAVRRWLAVVGAAPGGAADDLTAIWRLRHRSEAPWATTVAEIRARGDAVIRGQLAIDGRDVQALGIPPGPRIGAVLDRLLDRVLADPSLNTRERLTELARTIAAAPE